MKRFTRVNDAAPVSILSVRNRVWLVLGTLLWSVTAKLGEKLDDVGMKTGRYTLKFSSVTDQTC